MKRDISKKRLLPYPIEIVWNHLTKPEFLTWLNEAEIDFKEGGKIKLSDRKKGGVVTGEILTIQEPINFAYSWEDPSFAFTTYVWWKLMDKKGKTLLELEHSGFKGVKGVFASYSYNGFWSRKFKMLDSALKQIEVQQE